MILGQDLGKYEALTQWGTSSSYDGCGFNFKITSVTIIDQYELDMLKKLTSPNLTFVVNVEKPFL